MVNWETAKHMRHHLFVCIIYNWLKKYNKVIINLLICYLFAYIFFRISASIIMSEIGL